MRCKVLKDLPFAKAGEEVIWKDGHIEIGDRWHLWHGDLGSPLSTGWLEEIKDLRYFPKDGENYWYVNTTFAPAMMAYRYGNDEARVKVGNCFATEDEAAVLALRLRNCTQAYVMEIEARNKGKKADFSTILCQICYRGVESCSCGHATKGRGKIT